MSKQAYRVTLQPVSVVSQCSLIPRLNGMVSGDQRRLTGSGSALEESSRRCAIQMAAFTLLNFYNVSTTDTSRSLSATAKLLVLLVCTSYVLIYHVTSTMMAIRDA